MQGNVFSDNEILIGEIDYEEMEKLIALNNGPFGAIKNFRKWKTQHNNAKYLPFKVYPDL
jgi:hypothetical protein